MLFDILKSFLLKYLRSCFNICRKIYLYFIYKIDKWFTEQSLQPLGWNTLMFTTIIKNKIPLFYKVYTIKIHFY